VITISNEEILEHTRLVERHFKNASSAPLYLEKMLLKTLLADFDKHKEAFPKVIKIAKGFDSLRKGDLEPARVITLESPIMSEDGFPMWYGDSTDGVHVPGIGYKNGDSREPASLILGDKYIHLLLGGATGHGKSVTLNSMVSSVLYKYGPWEVRLTMADAKIVEFKKYADIPAPHISSIAATEDSDYLISVLETAMSDMLELNKILGKLGYSNIASFRKNTGLVIPQNLIIMDEVQTMIILAKRKASKIEEIFDLFGKLGRSTGYHLVLCSQDPGSLPNQILSNVLVRLALGCMPEVSRKVLGNEEGKTNLNHKGRLIVNLSPGNEKKEDNVHFRVPFQSDSLFARQKAEWSSMGDMYGFRYPLSYYDDATVLSDMEFKDYLLKLNDPDPFRFYLGEAAFVLRDGSVDGMLKFSLDSKDVENIMVSASSPIGYARYLAILKYNLHRSGNKSISNVFIADEKVGELANFEDTFPEANINYIREFEDPKLKMFIDAVYKRRLCIEADSLVFSGVEVNEMSDTCFYSKFEPGSRFDTLVSRRRAFAILNLLNQPFYGEMFGVISRAGRVPMETFLEIGGELIKYAIQFFELQKCSDGTRLTKERLTPIFNWIIGLDKIIGIGRDTKSDQMGRLKKVLMDCNAANIRFILSSPPVSDISELKPAFRYALMEGLDSIKAGRLGVEDYPDDVSSVTGVFFDKYSDSKEALKFKKISLGDEIL
jgi:hypothetical protein